ncbi:discoidin domain-containing receptor tyrosine kinase B [Aethina tumida]|uniref:discoidin domain-containing receptor tyrosine kinase B n=1 Tax=Aethina tumida TaxID=116153 RepID=UPI00096B18B8|nr:discoidin domain-containing receptor tyrosine kinase B [Aethina tumida]
MLRPTTSSTGAARAVRLLLLPLLAAVTGGRGVDALELGSCSGALGMESGFIKDSAISASSAYDSASVGPHHGRLRNDKNGGAWCPRHMVSRDGKEYLEINLDEMHVITGCRTQGRYGNGQGQEYAEEYMIEYWRPGFNKWVRWKNRMGKELLAGNTNTFTIVDQKLEPPVIASKFRFLPYSDHVRTVCMRVELLGCKWTEGLLSYSMPQGIRRGADMDLTDRTYDGKEESNQLFNGLGQLVDGQKGRDNFRLDLAGNGKGYEWVGWRNDTPGWAGHPLEILFQFDRVRNFSAAHLHTNNLFTKDVQVFSHARAFFSFNGNTFNGEPVHFSYMPDLVLEHARNVTIKLHQRIGRFLKLHLYFASRWILISEVSFDSVAVTGNFSEMEEDPPAPEVGREYPLQRDEVKTVTGTKSGTNNTTSNTVTTKTGADDEPKHYIGFVIGVLTVVILILVAAIVFIVFRNQRLKSGDDAVDVADYPTLRDDVKRAADEKIILDCNGDKAVLYLETNRTNVVPLSQTTMCSSEYSEVPDVVCQEYSSPQPRQSRSYSQSSRVKPPMLNFLPKPPPVPPPPENYYGRSSASLPVTPTLQPGLNRSSINSHYMLTLSPPREKPLQLVEPTFKEFPRDQLRIIEKLGDGRFGDVHLCETLTTPQRHNLVECKFVLVYTLRLDSLRGEFEAEVRTLSRIGDVNVSRLLGACLDSEPVCAVREYSPMGDLCQFLQDHVAETATPLAPTANTLSYGCLIYMATQVASGMKYLESLKYVHKDLAARNCLVGRRYEIKVSDLGSYRQMYSADYFQIADSRPLPIRWMAWESVILDKFTSKSDVWSFAVLLWEILTFAREQPFEEFSDDRVIENVTHFYQDDGEHVILDVPINCPKEMFDLMCECWQRNENDRPNFREIHLFLQRKNLGYNPDLH